MYSKLICYTQLKSFTTSRHALGYNIIISPYLKCNNQNNLFYIDNIV